MADNPAICVLTEWARQVRISIIEEIFYGGSGHPGGSLSCADILTALYFGILHIDPARPDLPGRDRLVLSKAHAAPALYAALALRGYFDPALLRTFSHNGSRLQKHIDMRQVPGVEISGGSLGQGLSAGVGMALAARMDGSPSRTFVCLGDGELDEGQNWEAAMAAAHFRLDRLTVIVDRNGLQVDGTTDAVMGLEPLADKWRAFGFETAILDGHDMAALTENLGGASRSGAPRAFIARTVKGKGVSFMENAVGWHAGSLTGEQARAALAELGGELE